jgi:RNA polymerase sigma-70 factor (ECF subfamily)
MSGPKEIIPTRQSLLSRLKEWNDQESWRVFFNTYWKLIYNAAMRAGLNDAEAQDVVQETVIAVSKNIPVYDAAKGSFKTWLMQQTRWRILGQLRKRMPIEVITQSRDTSTGTSAIEQIPDLSAPPLDALWDEEWERTIMEAAMQRVKARSDSKQYQIFDLCVRKKWAVSKVAKDLNISPARVYLAKHRIGNLIKREVKYLRNKPTMSGNAAT